MSSELIGMQNSHPRLTQLVVQARERAGSNPLAIALAYPCDALALHAAQRILRSGIARPLLVGPPDLIQRAGDEAEVDVRDFEIVASQRIPSDAALSAVKLARQGAVSALMKGSLHTDELMAAVVNKDAGLRGETRISHVFMFDLPRYPKLLALADCVVNIAPDLMTKRQILDNAIALLQKLGISEPKVGIVTALETVNAAIPATLDAQALVNMAREGAWPGAIVEGPCGFDNAISIQAARIKKIDSQVAGDVDLMLMPDLNAGNMLYKSFNYVGGGDSAGLVLGATVPIVLTSRSDSLQSRVASVAMAVLASPRF